MTLLRGFCFSFVANSIRPGLKLSNFVNESLMAGSPHLDGNLMDRFVIRAFEINVKGARKENFSKLSKRRKERKKRDGYSRELPPCTAESSTYYRVQIINNERIDRYPFSINLTLVSKKRDRESELMDK